MGKKYNRFGGESRAVNDKSNAVSGGREPNSSPKRGNRYGKNREFNVGENKYDIPDKVSREKRCPNFKKCGGCQLQNMSYPRQLSFKQIRVIKLLGRYHHVSEIIGMDNPLHYRNKVQAAFGVRGGKTVSGIYQSSTHRIVPVESCMIEDTVADAIIGTIRRLIVSFKIRPFDDNRMNGFLRHVLIRRGFKSGQIMVVLVTNKGEFPSQRAFINALCGKHPEITTVVRNINTERTSLVLGDRCETLFGDGYIEEQLCGRTFRISPKAFYQVNPVQTEVLYNKVVEFAELNGSETVIDAYCGTGTIGLILADKAKKIIGVELNSDAVGDARKNAEINGVDNAVFYEADASKFMVEMAEAGQNADVVIMDPPRAGSTVEFLRSVAQLKPKKVIYVSCNPQTLARDVMFLTHRKYKVTRIQPVDMFPYTEHVECVVKLEYKDKQSVR